MQTIITRHFNQKPQSTSGTAAYWAGEWKKSENEKTGTQSLNVPVMYDGTIYPLEMLIPYHKRRKMLRHPSIAMARQLAVAPMVLADWTIETYPETPNSVRWLIQKEVLARKYEILERALKDCIDFGFSAFEVVWNPDGKNAAGEDAVTIQKFKHLYPYITFLRANPKNGEFAGVLQYDLYSGGATYLEAMDVQLYNNDVEGSNHYGNSMLDNCVDAFDDWQLTKQISMGYLKKIGGAHWIVYYPDGITNYNGADTPNIEIANDLLRKLEANGGMAIPSDVAGFTFDQNARSGQRMWEVEQKTDSGSTSASYIEQLRYYDELMVMGFQTPPRALLEGHFGTRAEAVQHAEAAIASWEMISNRMAEMTSKQVVNNLLELNFGKLARDSAFLKVSPITQDNRDMLKEVYMALLSNPDSAYSLIQELNVKGIGDQLKINNLGG